jgi:hypothetical protein
MSQKTTELKTYSFTDEDINLITFAVRRLKESTGLSDIKEDSENLLEYIEMLKKEHK